MASPHRPHVPAAGKGPVGWDVYRHLDRLSEQRVGVQTRQFASTDPAGGNADGGPRCLRSNQDGSCVIAEAVGAGEIDSIWFSRDSGDPPGDVTGDGRVTIEVDGVTVLSAPVIDVVNGRLGSPFVYPLVANGYDATGGASIKVPMPYRTSMRVTMSQPVSYYHVTYKQFSDAVGVSTFDPKDRAEDVVRMLRASGLRDPKPDFPHANTQVLDVNVPGSGSADLAHLTGAREITQIRLRLPQLARTPVLAEGGEDFAGKGWSAFTVAVDPMNDGIRLTRRYDARVANQVATVSVDGQFAGTWSSGAASVGWGEQTIELPPELTVGKRSLAIRNDFVSSTRRWTEYHYDVSSHRSGRWTRTDALDVGPWHPGDSAAHELRTSRRQWPADQPKLGDVRRLSYPDQGKDRVNATLDLLGGVRLRITADGRLPDVDTPLERFFGSGIGDYDIRSLLSSIDPVNGVLTAWWPIPFAREATVSLVNTSNVDVTGAVAELTSAPISASAAGALAPDGTSGYFHATDHQDQPANGSDFNFIDVQGRGVLYGVAQSMTMLDAGNADPRWMLQGNERAFIDGSTSPAVMGTGTADFYESGFNFADADNGRALAGHPGTQLAGEVTADRCGVYCTSAYRLMLGDGLSFESDLRFGIEHGAHDGTGVDTTPQKVSYRSTVFWYGQENVIGTRTDSVLTRDATSANAHSQSTTSETTAVVESSYEGYDNGRKSMAAEVGYETGPISFNAAIDVGNAGIRIGRVSDQAAGYQSAEVFVDNADIGRWVEPLSNSQQRWLVDYFDIPASATAGKSSVTIKLVPSDGSPPWSAQRYDAISVVPAAFDQAVTEAENLPVTAAAVTPIIEHDCCGIFFSGDAQSLVQPTTIGQAVSYGMDVPADGVYTVYAALTRSPNYGIVRISVDDTQGVDVDTYDPRVVSGVEQSLGMFNMARGRHTLTLKLIGKNSAAKNIAFGLDVIRITTQTSLRYEAEGLPVTATDEGHSVQTDCCGVSWSGGAQLVYNATRPSSAITLQFWVPSDGVYQLVADQTAAADYGIGTVSVDGATTGSGADFYAPQVTLMANNSLSQVTLSAGSHTLTLTVTGKNAASKGYQLGLDDFFLVRS